ncbi:Glutamine amidotransferase class-I [Bosea sp. OK403]|uniref:glutamine amidotransferase-related protein n=1 Tax=Bosea sp. OK403 TaxID=1855286 RepID=UPI0008E3CC0E|nr:gamma-glutamyl-gamma-aminobutyrate hydrolase family protein [Bosea sp. OK403]SFJ52289.1 Glutamine amidotransferase class-I [Bosea sp. OK403]
MTLHLVIDHTARPARFGAAAAVVARRRGARFMHLPAMFDLAAHPDAEQYVHAAGGLGPSGLYFAERMLGRPIAAAASVVEILSEARQVDVVVPIHPSFGQDGRLLRAGALQAGIPIDEETAVPEEAEAAPAHARSSQPSRAICLVGREHDHRNVYPAALASLQDAIAALDLAIAIRFIDPRDSDAALYEDAAGILLPGGSDMGNVPGQIRAARFALARGVPVLGLCLGMQTMTTAFAQRVLGDGMVNLAEADPEARTKSFVAMAAETTADGSAILPEHRTGDANVDLVPGTRLAALMGTQTMRVRCNHRFHLAPSLRRDLQEAGLVVSASSFAGRVVDAVEWPAHPFFLGLQGHPELTPATSAPHPVFPAFLLATRDKL